MRHWELSTVDVAPHRPIVLSSEQEGRTVVLQLPAGETLREHQVHERAWLLVLDGEIEIAGPSGADPVTGGPGLLAEFPPKERHAVIARSDSRLLLWLAPWPGDGHPSARAARA